MLSRAPLTVAATDKRYARFSRGRVRQPVANYFGSMSQGFAASTTRSFRYPITVPVACSDLQLDLPNWAVGTSGGASLTVQAELEINGQSYPFSIDGTAVMVIPVGFMPRTDVLPVSIAAGTTCYLRLSANGAFPQGVVCLDSATGNAAHGTDAMGGAYLYGYHPVNVWATVASPGPVIVGVGDSITDGTGDNGLGHITRLGTLMTLPTLRSAKGGISTSNWSDVTATGGQHYRDNLAGATHAVVLLGTNDLAAGATAVTVIANLTAIYNELIGRGLNLVGGTILPRTNSNTDNTPVSGCQAGGPRTTVNTWIRGGGAGLLSGVADFAAALGTGTDDAQWSSLSNTVDGTHPTGAGHQAMAVTEQTALAPLVA